MITLDCSCCFDVSCYEIFRYTAVPNNFVTMVFFVLVIKTSHVEHIVRSTASLKIPGLLIVKLNYVKVSLYSCNKNVYLKEIIMFKISRFLKARLQRRFLSRQLGAIFVVLKLQQVSNMFETPAKSRRQIALKIAPGLHARL